MRRARPAWSAWLAPSRRRGARGGRHPRARAAATAERRDALRARHCAPRGSSRSSARGAAPRLAADARRAGGSPLRHRRSRRAWPSRSRSEPGRVSSCSTSAASARSYAASSSPASRPWSCPAPGRRTPCSSSTGGSPRRQRAGRSRAAGGPVETVRGLLGPRAALWHASDTSWSGSRSGWRRSNFPSGTAAQITRCE